MIIHVLSAGIKINWVQAEFNNLRLHISSYQSSWEVRHFSSSHLRGKKPDKKLVHDEGHGAHSDMTHTHWS